MDSIFQNKVFLICAAIIVWIAGYFAGQLFMTDMNKIPESTYTEAGVIFLPEPRALPNEVKLINQDNQPFSMQDFQGKWSLLFFGYTFCPDICPVTLVELRDIRNKIPADVWDKFQIFMVSVDPNRDTPEQLKAYLDYFEADFKGLTADIEQIQTLAKRVSIPFIAPDTSKEFYTVDHSGNLAILDPNGMQRGFIRAPLDIDKLANVLPHLFNSSK